MTKRIILDEWIQRELNIQRNTHNPAECCAILLGKYTDNPETVKADNVCLIKNVSGGGEFLMDPQQQYNIVRSVRNGGGNKFVQIVAHYHSHPPNCAGRPSATDIKMAKRGWNIGVHLIHGSDGINAFYWDGNAFTQIEVTEV